METLDTHPVEAICLSPGTQNSQNSENILQGSTTLFCDSLHISVNGDQHLDTGSVGMDATAPDLERSHSTNATSSGKRQAPDGGWGWVIAFCSHMMHFLTVGMYFSLSVMYVEWLEEFEAGRSLTSWVISVALAVTYGISPLPAYLASKFGDKKVVIVGGIMAAFGFAIAFFSQNVYMLIVALGLVAGSGTGFCYLPAVVSVASWFDKRRPLALGIGTAGVGIGSFVCAPFVLWLIQLYGWRGTLLVLAGVELNLCVFGLLLRPPPKAHHVSNPLKDTRDEDIGKNQLGTKADQNQTGSGKYEASLSLNCNKTSRAELNVKIERVTSSLEHLKRPQCDLIIHKHFSSVGEIHFSNGNNFTQDLSAVYIQSIFKSGSIHSVSFLYNQVIKSTGSNKSLFRDYSCKTKSYLAAEEEPFQLKQPQIEAGEPTCSIDNEGDAPDVPQHTKWTLLKDPVFITFLISNILTNIAFLTPVLFLVDRAKWYGISQTSAAMLISLNGAASVFGRLALPTACDWCVSDRLVSYIVGLLACGMSTALSVLCGSNFILHAIYATFFGSTIGMYTTHVAVVTADLVGVDMLGHAYGFMLLFLGPACLVGPPFAGWIFDVTGNYVAAYVINGFFLMASSLMLVPVAIWRRIRRRKL